VEFLGQAVAVVVAREMLYAREAARKAKVPWCKELAPILTIDEAMAAGSFIMPPKGITRGEPAAIASRATPVKGRTRTVASRSSSIWKARSPTPCRARTGSSRCTCPPSTPTATSARRPPR
jgi:CO/xanthine dehydrogenase Mo-binding subunit